MTAHHKGAQHTGQPMATQPQCRAHRHIHHPQIQCGLVPIFLGKDPQFHLQGIVPCVLPVIAPVQAPGELQALVSIRIGIRDYRQVCHAQIHGGPLIRQCRRVALVRQGQ